MATKDSAHPKPFGHFLRDSLYCFIVKDYVKGFLIHIETDNYLFTERNDIF